MEEPKLDAYGKPIVETPATAEPVVAATPDPDNKTLNGTEPAEPEDPDPNGKEAPEGEVRELVNQFKGPVTATNNAGEKVVPADEANLAEGELDGSIPMHNIGGYRCAFINAKNQMTIMDDETAQMFYDEPSFYSYVYDANAGDRVHVSTLRWCDRHGAPIGGTPGQSYERDA